MQCRKATAHIRVDSTTASAAIGTLTKNEEVTVLIENHGWYQIILPKRFPCYAASRFLKPVQKNMRQVAATNLNLRLQPTSESPIIGHISRDTLIPAISEKDDWTKLAGYPHTRGWVHTALLEKTPEIDYEKTITDIFKRLSRKNLTQPQATQELIALDTAALKYLEQYLNSDTRLYVYTAIHAIGLIAQTHTKIALTYLSKIDARDTLAAAAYLDIAQTAAHTPDSVPYYYLARRRFLTSENITSALGVIRARINTLIAQ